MVKVKNNEGKYVFKKKFVFLKQTSLGSIEISKSRKINFLYFLNPAGEFFI